MAVDPLIELRDVNKYFGELHVPQDVNLTVGRGEVVVVIGPSGSGKSTLCRAINISLGQVPPRPFRRWGSVAIARAKDFLSKILMH